MCIETKRLTVRTFRESDVEALYKIKTDPQVREYIPDFLDLDAQSGDMVNFIRKFIQLEESNDTDTWRCYAIEKRETGEVMGCISFGKSELLFEYELGWMMNGQHFGNGYAAEAAEAFAEYFCETHAIAMTTIISDDIIPNAR